MGEALAIAKMTEKQWDQKWEFVLGDQHNTVIILSMKLIVLMHHGDDNLEHFDYPPGASCIAASMVGGEMDYGQVRFQS